jgi:hypothetical protein
MKILLFFFTVLLVFSPPANAQRVTGTDGEEQDDPYEKLSYFMYGLNYLSNNVYLGRKDTTVLPYISPYIGYHHKSGLYTKVMASYAPTKSLVDLVTIEAGYEHSFGDHFNTGINVDKFFYNKKTTSIRGNTKGSAGIYGQYSNDWIEPQASFNLDFNKKTDFALNLQLDHDFKLVNNTMDIVPGIAMNAGTQHYYDEYFINRLAKKDKALKLKNALADAGKFKTLDYELSLKATYRITKWLFTLTPVYAIPVSPATITFPRQTFTEKLSNTFYIELDICHR